MSRRGDRDDAHPRRKNIQRFFVAAFGRLGLFRSFVNHPDLSVHLPARDESLASLEVRRQVFSADRRRHREDLRRVRRLQRQGRRLRPASFGARTRTRAVEFGHHVSDGSS